MKQYVVEIRCPMQGERYLSGIEVEVADRDFKHLMFPVVTEVVEFVEDGEV